jgi:hypothetical protein
MSRRATLPGADELFRRTSDAPEQARTTEPGDAEPASASASAATAPVAVPPSAGAQGAPGSPGASGAAESRELEEEAATGSPEPVRAARASGRRRTRTVDRKPTGRERHDEKITVYVSPDELVDIEQAKLVLRAQHGLAVDRGRIVREAIAVVIADLETAGEDSILVRRLRGL